MGFWTPEEKLDPKRIRPGLRLLAVDHVFSQSMASLTGGAFMVALVLALGGNNKTVGFIAAIGPIAQTMQLPAIFLVEKLRRRRAMTVIGAWTGRLMFLAIAAIPWVVPKAAQIPALLAAIAVHCFFGSISGCSYGSWVREVIPDRVMGRYMGKRLAWAIGVGAVVSLIAGVGVAQSQRWLGPIWPYSIVFALAGVLGMIGTAQLTRVPEPRMQRRGKIQPFKMLGQPLGDKKFRRVLMFMGWWAFALNFAAPFFAVYMLERLRLSLGEVVALTVMTQLVNVVFFPLWGRFADRFSTKAVMGASGLLYVCSFLLWPLMTLESSYWATWPLLIVAHLVMGVSTAGVALSSGNLALKAAPKGEATAYLATNALVAGFAAALSPLMAGPLADFFSMRELMLNFTWLDPAADGPVNVPAFNLKGLDFLFLIAFTFGLYALHRLTFVDDRGTVSEHEVLRELRHTVRRGIFSIAGPVGIRQTLAIPMATVARAAQRISNGNGNGNGNGSGHDGSRKHGQTEASE